MRVVAVLAFVLLSGIPALAQVSPFSVDNGLIVRTATPACPLGMHVRQAPGGQMVATDRNGAQVEMFAAHLNLFLHDGRRDKSSQPMVKATVTVRGWNGRARVLPADSFVAANGDLVKTFTVPLSGGGLPEASAELKLPGFTAARVVELESITFDDGQVWSFAGNSGCHVAPDPFMPVDDSK